MYAQIEILASLQTVDREIKEQTGRKQRLLDELRVTEKQIQSKKGEIDALNAIYVEREKARVEKDRIFQDEGVSARVIKVPQPWWRVAADPVLWSLLGYSLVGLVCYALALQRGSVTAVAAVTFTVETVVPAVIGLAWLGDGVRAGLSTVAALAFALTLAGCLRLAGHASPEVAA